MVNMLFCLVRSFGVFGVFLIVFFAVAGFAKDVVSHEPILQVDLVDTEVGRTQIELWSLGQLYDLPTESMRTTTPWTNGVQDFNGVSLAVFLDQIGVNSGEVELRASNDYSVSTTVAQLREDGALLAYSRNHALMSPREKGPLWLVFAYDATPDLRRETIYALSVWQLDRIRISR